MSTATTRRAALNASLDRRGLGRTPNPADFADRDLFSSSSEDESESDSDSSSKKAAAAAAAAAPKKAATKKTAATKKRRADETEHARLGRNLQFTEAVQEERKILSTPETRKILGDAMERDLSMGKCGARRSSRDAQH